ncbi:hypothetical protein L6452_06222 [Arctium lappa]|uniref:Uncharacterized protein n=1 Tax=Arctium lappa TaxID=4217 RepID=A0ACB9EJ81_ARCLA|nr:hypothetical protein L6452_06222 [Arctium lappa]
MQSRDLPADVPAVKPSSPPKNAEGITTEAAHKVLEEEQNHKSSFTEESRGANNDDQLVENNPPDRNGQEAANKETYASIVARPIPPQASRQVLADKPSSSVVSTTHVSSILPPKQVPAPSYVKTDKRMDIVMLLWCSFNQNLHVKRFRSAVLSSMTGNAELRPRNQEKIRNLIVLVATVVTMAVAFFITWILIIWYRLSNTLDQLKTPRAI